DNLQYMSFWIARGGGFFEKEGIRIDLVVPKHPRETAGLFTASAADAAVLPPPMFLSLIADRQPLVLVANLLRNDPINLVVQRSVADAKHLSPSMPLRDRLLALKGLKVGVAPHPPTRLRVLFTSVGLDADHDIEMVILHGKDQNSAFRKKVVDALYAHTPYLEQAIVQDDAVVIVEQTRGEIPTLAHRQIHGLVFPRAFLETHETTVRGAVRAISAAERSIHESQKATVETLARAFPSRDRRELETIVRLYEPAIPDEPEVAAEDISPGLALF